MNSILVISSHPDLVRRISEAFPDPPGIRISPDRTSALRDHLKTPYDLIFIDLDQMSQPASTEGFGAVSQPFRNTHPEVRIVAVTSKDQVRSAVRAVREGASEYLTYPFDTKEIHLMMESLQGTLSRKLELDYLRDEFWKTDWVEIIRTQNRAMKQLYGSIRSVAPTIASVLLLGETGTGKGLLARLIHWHSMRHAQPFVAVHCGAIPDSLLESELFGHEKGAFTGADRRKLGRFEVARGGTIFLDEIGTITSSAQIKLLQVLQDGTFSRVGGHEPLTSDARIIAATNADLSELVDKGLFRKDLFYRLNIFPIQIPPLRERREDLPHLAGFLLKRLNAKYGKGIDAFHPAVLEAFEAYDWPGNIRELENVVERAYILESGSMLEPENIPPDIVFCRVDPALPATEEIPPLSAARQQAVNAFEKDYLKKLLQHCQGKIGLSAQTAQITTRQLSRLMARYGIRKSDFKGGAGPSDQ